MDDFFSYFLAGMFGEELIRRLATKNVYFPFLWFICTVITTSTFVVLTIILFLVDLFSGHAPNQSFIAHAQDFLYFHFVITQPWAILFYSCLGLGFAAAYRWHYRDFEKIKIRLDDNCSSS